MRDSWVLRWFAPIGASLAIGIALAGLIAGGSSSASVEEVGRYWEPDIDQELMPAIWPEVESIAAAHDHADTHNELSMGERVELLRAGNLESWCLEVVGPALTILRGDGYMVRHVRTVGLSELGPDGKVPSHHLVELWDEQAGAWRVADIDHGQRFDQTAASMANRSWGDATPLERDARDFAYDNGYPAFMEAVGFVVPGLGYVYDPGMYSADQIVSLDAYGWVGIANFDGFFYGDHGSPHLVER